MLTLDISAVITLNSIKDTIVQASLRFIQHRWVLHMSPSKLLTSHKTTTEFYLFHVYMLSCAVTIST